jgi:hypothetical protein
MPPSDRYTAAAMKDAGNHHAWYMGFFLLLFVICVGVCVNFDRMVVSETSVAIYDNACQNNNVMQTQQCSTLSVQCMTMMSSTLTEQSVPQVVCEITQCSTVTYREGTDEQKMHHEWLYNWAHCLVTQADSVSGMQAHDISYYKSGIDSVLKKPAAKRMTVTEFATNMIKTGMDPKQTAQNHQWYIEKECFAILDTVTPKFTLQAIIEQQSVYKQQWMMQSCMFAVFCVVAMGYRTFCITRLNYFASSIEDSDEKAYIQLFTKAAKVICVIAVVIINYSLVRVFYM